MEKMILSLKTLYMTLMTEDFPIYSESVIGKSERKGQTMLHFWQEQIVEEFRCLPCGRMIWRNDGKRNRYTSYLCNRSAEIKTYAEYAGELASKISSAALLNQIKKFSEFLSGRKYRHDILLRRIPELIRLTGADDPRVSEDIRKHIMAAVSWTPDNIQGSLFQAAYLITVLMLYAAAGEAMDGPAMSVLRSEEYSPQALWKINSQLPAQAQSAVRFLTVHSGRLQEHPLPQHRFFGREEELFNLKEMAAAKQKCLITGIGGIGKTELLRQLICRCTQDRIVDRIAVVPYRNSLAESFVQSFPGYHQPRIEDSFRMILHHLHQEAKQGKLLLLIDDLTNNTEEDADLAQLAALDCAVLVTTRHTILEGFEVCPLEAPSIRTGALIFRDNYGRPLSSADQQTLAEMLADEMLCHPLTLKLMAIAAKKKNWSVLELKKHLAQNGLTFSWQEDQREVRMTQLYRQLYSFMQLPDEYHTLAELYTLLPRRSYSAPFLCKYFPDIAGSEPELREKCDAMAANGWLEGDADGYSMHPVIAQCLRRKTIPEKWLAPIFAEVCRAVEQQGFEPMGGSDAELQAVCEAFVYAADRLTGPISPELMKSILLALYTLTPNRKSGSLFLGKLEKQMKRCHRQDDALRLWYLTVQGRWHGGSIPDFMTAYEQQKEDPSVPGQQFRSFCYYAAESLVYQHEHETAQKLLEELLCNDASEAEKAAAYYLLAVSAEMQGNAEAFLSWIDQGVKFVRQHSGCGQELTFHILSIGCGAYTKFGMKDAAQPLLCWMEEHIPGRNDPVELAQYETIAGTYALYFGNPEDALVHYRKARQIHEGYWENDSNYIQLLGQIAIAQQRLKRYDEALDTYLSMQADVSASGSAQLLHMFSNNIAVVYLELNRPEDALAHLETAMIQARQYGGVALGEVQRNRARAFGLLGNTGQEYACLKEAAPLLEAAYGTEHPKVQTAKMRLLELGR